MFFVLLFAAYLFGSFPTALIIGKLAFDVDIRELGSHNPGATNSLRVFGTTAAIIVMIVDVGKGILAAALPAIFHLNFEPLYFGFAAVIGHCFPIFAGFRGGKAIATTAGALVFSSFPLFATAYLTFFLIIFLSKYVFLGSISVGIALLAYSFVSAKVNYELIFILFSMLLLYLHRSNFRNLILGIEPKINDKKLKKDRIPPKKRKK